MSQLDGKKSAANDLTIEDIRVINTLTKYTIRTRVYDNTSTWI